MKDKIFTLWAILFLMGCTRTTPKALIDNFYSYQTQEEVKAVIGDNIKFIGNKEGLMQAVTQYEHLSEEGKLGFVFFENKLTAVGFYPEDTLSYLRKVEGEFGTIKLDEPINSHGVLIQKGHDYEIGSIGGFFISWGDADLIKQYENTVW